MKLFIARGYTKGLDGEEIVFNNLTKSQIIDDLVGKLDLSLLAYKEEAYRHKIELDSFPLTFTSAEKVMWINNVCDAGDIALEFAFSDQDIDGVSIIYEGSSSFQHKEASILARILSNETHMPNLGAVSDEKFEDRINFVKDIRCRTYRVCFGFSNQKTLQKFIDSDIHQVIDAVMKVFLNELIGVNK